MQGITEEMTVSDALPLLSPAQQINLQHWAAEFGIMLREFHLGHIRTYENERLRTESRYLVNAEVSTLLNLLEFAGVGDEIRRPYELLRAAEELSPDERAAMPDRALHYIQKLEGKIEELETQNQRAQDHLRKANGAKWTR
jgi:hypothetical protein